MSIFVSDSFNQAGTGFVDLNTHTGELGAVWTDHPAAAYTTEIRLDLDNDRIYAVGTAAYYASGVPPSADYYVAADFWNISSISQNIAVCLRMDTTADTMMIVRFNSGTTWEMRSIVAAVSTTLTGGTSTSQIPSVGNFVRGKFIAQGNQYSFYANDILVIGPITDNSISAAGRAGVRNAGTASATTGFHLDNFEAGDLVLATGQSLFQANRLRPALFKPGRAR